MAASSTGLPVGGRPSMGPVLVPRRVHRMVTRSPSAIRSSMLKRRSGWAPCMVDTTYSAPSTPAGCPGSRSWSIQVQEPPVRAWRRVAGWDHLLEHLRIGPHWRCSVVMFPPAWQTAPVATASLSGADGRDRWRRSRLVAGRFAVAVVGRHNSARMAAREEAKSRGALPGQRLDRRRHLAGHSLAADLAKALTTLLGGESSRAIADHCLSHVVVADIDELHHARRRHGQFAATCAWVITSGPVRRYVCPSWPALPAPTQRPPDVAGVDHRRSAPRLRARTTGLGRYPRGGGGSFDVYRLDRRSTQPTPDPRGPAPPGRAGPRRRPASLVRRSRRTASRLAHSAPRRPDGGCSS